jgi:plasmid stability protein
LGLIPASQLDGKLGSWEYGSMKTTLDLPDALFREVKLRAVVQGRTVKDLVAELLQQGLGLAPTVPEEKRPTSARIQISENGLPLIPCAPNAPATRLSVETLRALEQDSQNKEDLNRAGLAL